MDLRDIVNTRPALRLGHWLGRVLPLPVGYALADTATTLLARRRNTAMVQVLTNNLGTVLGPDASPQEVQGAVQGVLNHAGRVYVDLYKALSVGPEAFLAAARTTPLSEYYLNEAIRQGRGAMIVGPHISNFDLAALYFAYRGYKITGLSFAVPPSGYNMQNEVRLAGGIDIMPIDVSALRKAMAVLKSGNIVATAVDRPDPFGGGEMFPFFGRPARLPVGHVRLALQTKAPVLIGHCEYRETDHSYTVHISRWMEMERVGSKEEDTQHNTRRVLSAIEEVILTRPRQWLMFYPVWDETLPGGVESIP